MHSNFLFSNTNSKSFYLAVPKIVIIYVTLYYFSSMFYNFYKIFNKTKVPKL